MPHTLTTRSLSLGLLLSLLSLPAAHAGHVEHARTMAWAASDAQGHASAPAKAAPASSGDEAAAEQAMLGEINRVRAAHGLSAVTLDRALSSVARKHSEEMNRLHFFDHMSPV